MRTPNLEHGRSQRRSHNAFLKAVSRLIDPRLAMPGDAAPCIMIGCSPLDTMQLILGAAAVAEFHADLIHLEFAQCGGRWSGQRDGVDVARGAGGRVRAGDRG